MRRVLLCPLSVAALAVLLSAPAQAVDCDTSMSSYTTQINCNNGWYSGSAQHTCSDRQISVPTAGCCKIRAKCERWSGDSDGNWSDITVNPKFPGPEDSKSLTLRGVFRFRRFPVLGTFRSARRRVAGWRWAA